MSCASAPAEPSPPVPSPADAAKALAEKFLAACKAGDDKASMELVAWPFWVDRHLLDEAKRSEWQKDWDEFSGEIGKEKVARVVPFALPAETALGNRARETYGALLQRAGKDAVGVDVFFEGKDRGIGFVCGRTAKGWKIFGIDDNGIEAIIKD